MCCTFTMKHILLVLVFLVIVYGLTDESSCKHATTHEFKRMVYHDGAFYTSGGHCVCRFNMSLVKVLCVGITDQHKTMYDTLLIVDKENGTLIACGTGTEVSCQVLTVTTLNTTFSILKSHDDVKTSTVIGNGNKVIAFISWGMSEGNYETVLYTATNNNNDKMLSPLSVRSLRGENMFQLFNQNEPGSRIELVDNETITNSYFENFEPVGGFAYDGMAYFVTNQLKDAESLESDQQPKLIRLCQDDNGTNHWLTYKDIAITCPNTSRVYSANLLPVGNNLRHMNESWKTNDTHVMLALFFAPKFSFCLYTFDTIGSAFEGDSLSVTKRYLKPNSTPTCKGLALSCNVLPGCRNDILAGNITGNPVWTFDYNLTDPSIASGTILNGSFTVILVTPNDTYVNAFYLNGSSPSNLVLFRELNVTNKPHVMKIIDDEVYLLTDSTVTRESLHNSTECSIYKSAHTCITKRDPFCGWCRTKTGCTTLRDCEEEESWLSVFAVNTLGEISNHSVSPSCGPLSGGTMITITGENFDLYQEIELKIDNNTWATIETGNGTTLTYLTPSWSAPALLNISIILSDEKDASHANFTFEYLDDPTVASISPNRSFASGGRTLTVIGSNFNTIQNPRIQIVGENISEGCDRTTNNSIITCRAPEATDVLKKKLEEGQRRRSVTEGNCGSPDILCVEVEFQMDGVNRSLLRQSLELTRDPVFYNFTEEGGTKQYSTDARSIVIMGERLNFSAKAADYDVTVGKQTCDVLQSKLSRYEFHCLPPAEQPQPLKDGSDYPEVWVRLGNIERHVGFLHYLPPEEEHYVYLYILVGILCLIVAVLIVVGVLLRRRSRRAVKKLQNDMQDTEMRIQTEFRQAFADLQTDMTDITGELVETGLPYHSFPVYAFQILFPADNVTSMTSHKIFNYPETSRDVTDVDAAMMKLDELFQNKFFLLSIIDTLEKEKKLTLSEKASLASCVSTLLVHDLNLFSQLVKGLLKQYVTDVVLKKKHKSLFRRCQSITERMTEMWLGVCLHDHLLESRGGSALIMMVKAIQTVMMKSPIDAVTDAARATLSYEQLLLFPVDNDDVIRLQVMINDGACQCSCAVLACDSIGQVKAKCLGVMYKKDPASKRPTKDHVELQWHCGKQGRLILEERDTKPSEDNCVKLMTLADYHVTDGALMELLNKEVTDEEEEYANIHFNAASQNDVNVLIEEEIKGQDKETSEDKVKRHLVKPDGGNVENKLLPEVHLNRLLQTKLNVKEYVDEALDSALDRKDIPVVVKFIYTELDELASRMGVDNNTLLSWKNNCYPIRFWGQLILKPGIIFDVDVPSYLKPSLDVVAKTFSDSFIPAHPLSKNSAPHKLLFYKDQEDYRQWVKSFHRAVTNTPSLDEREFAQHMNELSGNQKFAVKRTSVLYEIYKVLLKFKVDIVDGLEEDKDASRLGLPEKLEHVFEMMDNS